MRFFILFFLCLTLSNTFAQNATDKNLIYTYYQQGDYEKVYSLTEKVLNQTKDAAYFNLYINAVFKLKNFSQAEQTIKKLVTTNPKNDHYAITLGRIYQENGDTTKANKIYEQVILNLDADEAKVLKVARLFSSFNVDKMVEKTLLKGRKLLKNNSLFSKELAQIYIQAKDKQKLIPEYLNLLKSKPEQLVEAENTFSNLLLEKKDYDELQTHLLKIIQKEPEKEVFSTLLIWQYIQKEEYNIALQQLIAQDKRTNNNNGENVFKMISGINPTKNAVLINQGYEYIISLGKQNKFYLPAKIALMNIKYEQYTNTDTAEASLTALANEYDAIITEYGLNNNTFSAFKKWGELEAYYLNNPNKVIKKIETILNAPFLNSNDAGNLKLLFANMYVVNNEPWEALLIYQQVATEFANKELGQEATFRSAKLSYFQGDFAYAKAQIDVLKIATSQLTANDALNLSLLLDTSLKTETDSLSLKIFAQAELLEFKHQNKDAIAKLDSLNQLYPTNMLKDAILMLKSKIFLKTNAITKATSALEDIIQNYPESIWIDDALFLLAEIYETKLNNPNQAKSTYQKLITEHSSSLFASEARIRFRNLRGE